MNKKSLAISLALLFCLVTSVFVGAQDKSTPAPKNAAASPLALLPPSDFVAFVNVKRLITEAAPKALAGNSAKLAQFNAEIDKLKAQTGIDARSFEHVGIGMKYQHPSPGITTTDTVMIASGSFNSGALLAAARLASKGRYQEEKYSGQTIYIFQVDQQVRPLGLFNMRVRQLAVAALDSNTVVLGEPVSVRATLDNKATGRVNADLIRRATKSPSALIGFSANVPPALTQSLDLNNDELNKIIGSIRQAYGAIGTTGNGFDLLAVARTTQPDEAKRLAETFDALRQFGGMVVTQLPAGPRAIAQSALENLKITSEGNETLIKLDLTQAVLSTWFGALQPGAIGSL